MRVLVCGSRTFDNEGLLYLTLSSLHFDNEFSCVIEGEAKGADTLAREWAESRLVPVERYPADWGTHGRAAGPIRNRMMLEEGKPDLVVAFLAKSLAESKGTANMVKQAMAAGVKVQLVEDIDS